MVSVSLPEKHVIHGHTLLSTHRTSQWPILPPIKKGQITLECCIRNIVFCNIYSKLFKNKTNGTYNFITLLSTTKNILQKYYIYIQKVFGQFLKN